MRWIWVVVLGGVCWGQKVAITLDDLPLNGDLPAGVTREKIALDVVKLFKKRHVPPVYGFVNSGRLEGNPDGAAGLKAWAAAEPVGNHTYTHINLSDSTVEQFERNIVENEPALELLARGDWHWFRYPYLVEGDTVEKRRAVRAILAKRGYRIAQITMDWEDYLWNSAAARCQAKNDVKAMEWLHSSYLSTASTYIDYDRELAKLVYGREISHVLLLHLGAYSSTILPEVFDLLKKKGLKLVTLEEAESDSAYADDPDLGLKDGGSLVDQMMVVKKIPFPKVEPKPYKELDAVCR
jgi:peptidoglycan/xylan/chitin deacetylase (PgdA/CDA1 family)